MTTMPPSHHHHQEPTIPFEPSGPTYPSPLAPYQHLKSASTTDDSILPPLPDERAADGKSYVNPAYVHPSGDKTRVRSESYERFVEPLSNGIRGGFDVHIYYFQQSEEQKTFARELWERIRREFPELRIYKFWEQPIGPHPVAMFEVNLFTPAQFGAFIPWLVINRGPLSALIHPNTEDSVTGENTEELTNHTLRATWMGERMPLYTRYLRD